MPSPAEDQDPEPPNSSKRWGLLRCLGRRASPHGSSSTHHPNATPLRWSSNISSSLAESSKRTTIIPKHEHERIAALTARPHRGASPPHRHRRRALGDIGCRMPRANYQSMGEGLFFDSRSKEARRISTHRRRATKKKKESHRMRSLLQFTKQRA